MKKSSSGIVVVSLLVTVLALALKQFHAWGLTATPVAWWGIMLLVPIYITGTGAMRALNNGRRKRAVNLFQASLFTLVVMAAIFFPVLWKYIYIPFTLIVALYIYLLARIAEK